MAGRTNDRELLALARTNKTPALQANPKSVFIKLKESEYVYWDIITARIIFFRHLSLNENANFSSVIPSPLHLQFILRVNT